MKTRCHRWSHTKEADRSIHRISSRPERSILAVCTDLLTVPAACHNLAGLINYEARKPVRIRRGRATVIELGLMGMRLESQTFLRSI
jgi:hypothetical protein